MAEAVIEWFIYALKLRFKLLCDLKAKTSPYFALQVMLLELMEVRT
jgi:hypothetical protein